MHQLLSPRSLQEPKTTSACGWIDYSSMYSKQGQKLGSAAGRQFGEATFRRVSDLSQLTSS
jgi:hypothetical protein